MSGDDFNLSNEEILNRVSYHAPSEAGAIRHAKLTKIFEKVIREVRDICPVSRERSIAITKLEEAKMWCSAAVARTPRTR